MISSADITGLILCGGEGRRLGAGEKPFALAGGVPLIAHVRRRVAPQVGEIIISANRRLGEYSAWGDPVIPDVESDLGPLGGLLSALQATRTSWAFCCPGDAPRVPETLVARLAEQLELGGVGVAVPHDGDRLQPLFLLMRTDLREDLRAFVAAGGRAAHQWVERQPHAILDVSGEHERFANVNSPEDLARMDQLLTPAGVVS